MDVIRAQHAGACYGVQRALDMAYLALETYGEACTLGPLIHNPQVVSELEQCGVQAAETVDEIMCPTVIIRSHGVTPEVRKALVDRLGDASDDATADPDATADTEIASQDSHVRQGIRQIEHIVDATCPHVARAQTAAEELAADGCRVLVVGEAGHPEVESLIACAQKEGVRVDVVANPDDIPTDLTDPVGVVVQTTQMVENLNDIVEALELRGLSPVVRNTICAATSQRQNAAAELATRVDAMVVVGGRNSSNTTRLAEICAQKCPLVFHVESPSELEDQKEILRGCAKVGVTAGASTPETQIQDVVNFLTALS